MSDEAADTAQESDGDAHPAWCVIDHGDDEGRDRHESRGVAVPVEMLVGEPGEPSAAAARELVVIRRRDAAGRWIYAGDGMSQHLELTPESWTRVRALIDHVLAEMTG